jgi:hypothetical protein
MKKLIAVLLGFFLVSAISMAMVAPAKAGITIGMWKPPYVDIDGTVIYKDGTTASALIGIINDVAPGYVMNVSKITLNFFTVAMNRSLDMSSAPHQLQHDAYGAFTVSFTADAAAFYPGLSYNFNVIIEWVNATSGPTKVVGSWTYSRGSIGMEFFQVYPAAQVDAIDSLQKYQSYYNFYFFYSWHSILAQQKANQAVIEKGLGDTSYNRGDYASALTHYNAANTLWEDAIAAEGTWRTRADEADLNVSLTEASANMRMADAAYLQASAAMTNANGWFFMGIGFAIGFSLIGIGAVIYALRKPKPPA